MFHRKHNGSCIQEPHDTTTLQYDNQSNLYVAMTTVIQTAVSP